MRSVDLTDIVTDDKSFMTDVLTTFQNLRSMLHWEVAGGQVKFSVNPGSGVNGVPVTPETLPDMKFCLELVRAVDPGMNMAWAVLLFASRYHQKHLNFAPDMLQHLFDAVVQHLLDDGDPERL